MRLIGTTAAACIAALGAQAQTDQHHGCPVGPEDARDTISVRYNDGTWSRITALGDDLIEDSAMVNPTTGLGQRQTSLHGFYLIDEVPLSRGEARDEHMISLEYDGGTGSLPAPEPELEWQGTAQVTRPDGGSHSRTVSLSIGAAEEADYGDCFYENWPVEVEHADADRTVVYGYDYLPELELAIFRSYAGTGERSMTYYPLMVRTAAFLEAEADEGDGQ